MSAPKSNQHHNSTTSRSAQSTPPTTTIASSRRTTMVSSSTTTTTTNGINPPSSSGKNEWDHKNVVVPVASTWSSSTSAPHTTTTSAHMEPSAAPPVRTTTTQHHPHSTLARIQFCQFDVLACINCTSSNTSIGTSSSSSSHPTTHWNSSDTGMAVVPPQNGTNTTHQNQTTTTTTMMSRKLGPLLLDLRRLHWNNHQRDHDHQNDETTTNTTPSLFSTTVIAQSRGNPSLGSSIYSTCLTVPSRTNIINDSASSSSLPPLIATGLSTGALCIHSFATTPSSDLTGRTDPTTGNYSSSIEYYQIPRNNRPATSVAWRPNHVSQVAIGYAHSSSISSSTNATASSTGAFPFASNTPDLMSLRRPAGVNMGGTTTGAGGGGGGGLSSNPSTVVDRQYCCFLWDVEHQTPSLVDETSSSSPPIRRTKTTPLYKLSHNQGVLCLSWILDEGGGQILAVGGQQRNIQLYDLRLSGSTTTSAVQPSPISAFGHTAGVHGIEADPLRPWHFCSYASSVGEVVKLWDVRRIDAPLSEIKPVGTKNTTATITSAKWSTLSPGHLSILVGETTLSTYDTLSTVSRPIFTTTTGANETITAFTQYPYANLESHDESTSTTNKKRMMLELFPKQIVAVCGDNTINVVSCHRIAPLAVSPRNGQIVHSIGRSKLCPWVF